MERLSDTDVTAALARLPGWNRDGDSLVRTFGFADFGHAMEFVNLVAEMAQAANHHPDIDIRYNKVTLRLSTHSAGGLTTHDVELAQGIDGLTAG
jgi:4a-hydroxytetrahydrobiopterin dehydratase